MKKIVSLVLVIALALSIMCVTANATDKSDLLNEMAKSPVYKYLKVSVENAARSVNVTDEQAEKLLPIIQKGVALLSEDKGSGVYDKDLHRLYTVEEEKAVFALIDEACAIMNFHYILTPSANPMHQSDIVFKLYDQDDHLIFSYDGDVVADTGIDVGFGTTGILIASVTLLVVGFAAFFIVKKRFGAGAV